MWSTFFIFPGGRNAIQSCTCLQNHHMFLTKFHKVLYNQTYLQYLQESCSNSIFKPLTFQLAITNLSQFMVCMFQNYSYSIDSNVPPLPGKARALADIGINIDQVISPR